MATEKPLYKMTIDFVSYRPDALNDALDRLNELAEEFDQTPGQIKTKATIESDSEEAIRSIRYQLETYLKINKTVISGKVGIEEPLVRPEPEPTPMDKAWQDFADKNGASITGTLFGRPINVEPVGSDAPPRG